MWDHNGAREEAVSNLIRECGALPRWVQSDVAIRAVKLSARSSLLVAALGVRPGPGDGCLELIRTLRQKGFKVLSYEDGAESWPLGVRCRVLLAGALCLLDAASQRFMEELRDHLTQLLRAETRRRAAQARIKEMMRELGIVGESESMHCAFGWVLRVSVLSDVSVLLTGETGTGKELLARAIHQLDPKRRGGPFVAVNCSSISPGLAESELFGHRYGAFTGAVQNRLGLIRSAQGGVLLLDEIGEFDLALQAKLLRVLQERHVLGVGQDREVPINVRIIAATNRNLDEMIRQGRFRPDLFHRLNAVSLRIPPLRERREDIRPLVEHFLEKHRTLRSEGATAAAPEYIEALHQIDLPGNARQLENLIRHALINKDDQSPLGLADLPMEVWRQMAEPARTSETGSEAVGVGSARAESLSQPARMIFGSELVRVLDANAWSLSRSIHYCEEFFLESALKAARGNHSQAARMLGITPRTVYNKLRKYHRHS